MSSEHTIQSVDVAVFTCKCFSSVKLPGCKYVYQCLEQERRGPGLNCLYYCESSQLIDVPCRAVDLYCPPYTLRLSFQISGSGEAWQGPARAPRLNCLWVNGEGEGSEVSSFPAHSSARTHSNALSDPGSRLSLSTAQSPTAADPLQQAYAGVQQYAGLSLKRRLFVIFLLPS